MKTKTIISILTIFLNSSILFSETKVLVDSIGLGYHPEIYAGPSFNITDIDCIDEMNCILTANHSGNGGMILSTTNGGKSWEKLFSDKFNDEFGENMEYLVDYDLNQSVYIDSGHIITTDYFAKKFFVTKNNGVTWDTLQKPIDEKISVFDIDLIDNSRLFLFSHDLFRRTLDKSYISDDHITWNEIEVDIEFIDTNRYRPNLFISKYHQNIVCFLYQLIDKKNKLYKDKTIVLKNISNNSQKVIKTPDYMIDAFFFDEKEGIAVGGHLPGTKIINDTAVIYKTYDGGLNWHKVYVGDSLSFRRADFIDYFSDEMIVVRGKGNNIMLSKDKGETWNNIADKSLVDIAVGPMCIASENVIYYILWDNLVKWEDGKTKVIGNIYNEEVKIFPNPVEDFVHIEYNNNLLFDHFMISNLNGKYIKTGKFLNNEIEVSELSSGLYFLTLFDKEISKTIKFIKK